MEIENTILNEILVELKFLRKEVKGVKNLYSIKNHADYMEKNFDSLSYSNKDLEIFKLIIEMEERNLWGSESDLKKSGIEI